MRNEQATRLLFELSRSGARSARMPACDVPQRPLDELLPAAHLADAAPPLPEVTEPEIVRHFVNLSTLNFSVDTHFYPLGSCTMKYNPKRNERLAGLPGLAALHPYQDEGSGVSGQPSGVRGQGSGGEGGSTLQGLLELLWGLQNMLAEIAGLHAVSLQPAAGAHGELTSLLVAAEYFRSRGEKRTKVLIPDSAHGTNPSSAAIAGFEAVQVDSNERGMVDLEKLKSELDEQVGVFMITNPNTLGLFEEQIQRIAHLVHDVGGLLYLDGANMNAIMGVARPGDFGADLMHYNPHKTFSGPHGAGGPGAGPIAVREMLAPFLPAPVVARRDVAGTGTAGQASSGTRYAYYLDYDRPQSISRVRSFFGNTGVLVRAYCYIRTYGAEGLRQVAENAVLNANYLLQQVKDVFPVPYGDRCMHEFVATARPLFRERGVRAMDVVKRLLDFGYHAPTVYFPLVVPEALMIEPTETESKRTLDSFAEALARIVEEDAERLHEAPHNTPISRPDEVRAARQPVLRWRGA